MADQPVPVEEFDGGAEEDDQPANPVEAEPTYLGDGVYARNDGWHLVLTADGTKTIFLEPGAYRALAKFAEATGFGGEG